MLHRRKIGSQILLGAVSKILAPQDEDTAEVDEAERGFPLIFVAGTQASKIMQPSAQAFHEPAPPIASQGPAVLGCGLAAMAFVGRYQLDAFGGQLGSQGSTVIGPVTTQAGRPRRDEAGLSGRLPAGACVGWSRAHADGERKTSTVCHRHELRPLAPFTQHSVPLRPAPPLSTAPCHLDSQTWSPPRCRS